MPDLHRKPLEARACESDRLQQLSVPVAGHHLGRNGLWRQAQPIEHAALKVGRSRGISADGSRDRAHRDLGECALETLGVARRLEGERGQLDAERGRLGVDPVGAAHG